MRDVNNGGYGVTGVKGHPYHAEFGADTYYQSPVGDNELTMLFHKAEHGLQAIHELMAARAMQGDLNAMECFSEINRVLAAHGYVGFPCNRKSPWQESCFNHDRPVAA